MTDPSTPEPHGRKRRTLDDVFGDVLPDVTDDERTEEPGAANADAWYQENRPPHHDPR